MSEVTETMVHPLVEQLRFARSEWRRALAGVEESDARRQFPPINCISWMIGHLAWQEQRYWLTRAQGRVLLPDLNTLVAYGAPACTPPLAEMWQAWEAITRDADPFLDTLTSEHLARPFTVHGRADAETAGTRLLRTTYHYWYHIGESQAVRQLLGHTALPDFVGDIGSQAPWRPERA